MMMLVEAIPALDTIKRSDAPFGRKIYLTHIFFLLFPVASLISRETVLRGVENESNLEVVFFPPHISLHEVTLEGWGVECDVICARWWLNFEGLPLKMVEFYVEDPSLASSRGINLARKEDIFHFAGNARHRKSWHKFDFNLVADAT